jgi:hypothetical protein
MHLSITYVDKFYCPYILYKNKKLVMKILSYLWRLEIRQQSKGACN